MYSNRSHPLLEQVPLTVSPFVSLPAATTLSYNYKTMPSTLPPSSTGIPAAVDDSAEVSKPKYVISQSGHAAHPDDIIASCRALQAHIGKMQEDAERELREFEERIKARELAEKRRVAPGWLDSEARILEPERRSTPMEETGARPAPPGTSYDRFEHAGSAGSATEMDTDQGIELDRAFGGLAMK